jgi:hypothetical protein
VFWQNTFESVLYFQNTFESVLDFQNTFESVFWQTTFEIYLLGQFIHIGEKLFQHYILKSFLVIGDYKKIWNRAKIFFWSALSIAPPLPPPPIQCLPAPVDNKRWKKDSKNKLEVSTILGIDISSLRMRTLARLHIPAGFRQNSGRN